MSQTEDTPSAPATVVLLHGFAGLPVMNQPLARRLRRLGYETRLLGYDSWGKSLPEICGRLAPRLAMIATAARGPLHLVGHSMGGLVARALIQRQRPANLGRVVMLGTPNSGSELADFAARWAITKAILGKAEPALITRRPAGFDALLGTVDYPVGIVAGNRPISLGWSRLFPGPHDGKVSVASTRLASAADHIVLPLAHEMLPYHRDAQRQVAQFLAHGRFERIHGTDRP
jgi:pimeloyl-ACP methyl ester carboxylesterase